jgi:hypothetical protein
MREGGKEGLLSPTTIRKLFKQIVNSLNRQILVDPDLLSGENSITNAI